MKTKNRHAAGTMTNKVGVLISRFRDGPSHELGQEISRVWAHEFGKGLAYHELGNLARAGGIWGGYITIWGVWFWAIWGVWFRVVLGIQLRMDWLGNKIAQGSLYMPLATRCSLLNE